MKNYPAVGTLLMLFLFLTSPWFIKGVSAQQPFSEFIAFGDSLSDTGNLASSIFIVPLDFPSPYFQNRISNGPVAIDYLAPEVAPGASAQASEEGGNNYSVAGGNIIGVQPQDLSVQIDRYLARVNGVANPDSLYFIMMGGNDLRDLRNENSEPIAMTKIVNMVNQLINQLTRIKNSGGRNFFVANAADIGRIPEILMREATQPGISERLTRFSKNYNSLLKDRLSEFSQDNQIELIEYDLFTAVDTILDNPVMFGFTETTVGCFDTGSDNPLGILQQGCLIINDIDDFVFFDNIHPTARAHEIIGLDMIEKLAQGLLPEPPPPNDMPIILSAIYALLFD